MFLACLCFTFNYLNQIGTSTPYLFLCHKIWLLKDNRGLLFNLTTEVCSFSKDANLQGTVIGLMILESFLAFCVTLQFS